MYLDEHDLGTFLIRGPVSGSRPPETDISHLQRHLFECNDAFKGPLGLFLGELPVVDPIVPWRVIRQISRTKVMFNCSGLVSSEHTHMLDPAMWKGESYLHSRPAPEEKTCGYKLETPGHRPAVHAQLGGLDLVLVPNLPR